MEEPPLYKPFTKATLIYNARFEVVTMISIKNYHFVENVGIVL
jgi:hypothetical protein